jgi:preprotein translocase subunit SecG
MFPMIFAVSIPQYVLGILLFVVSLFLILLILVQRGRGGGLTGALGGMGGQSAFGSKAGDLFTRVTIVVASVWIVLCLLIVTLFTKTGFANTGVRTRGADTKQTELDQPLKDKERTSGGAGSETGSKGSSAPAGKGKSGS